MAVEGSVDAGIARWQVGDLAPGGEVRRELRRVAPGATDGR
ncbi:MAG: hypothetical protein R3F43_24345 [bacterium]